MICQGVCACLKGSLDYYPKLLLYKKQVKRFFSCLFASIAMLLAGCYSPPVQPSEEPHSAVAQEEAENTEEDNELPMELELLPPGEKLPVSYYREIWAYLVRDREEALKVDYPISDLGYFGAELDSYGKLIDVPDIKRISYFSGRVHLVVACNSKALTHFVLIEGSAERKALIRDLLEAAKPFHGLQIDFENVLPKDGDAFLSFLRDLRAGLKGKIFSVALPARTRILQDDVYDYTKIKGLADRILVMAYDEHWSTSDPGPIASMGWCQRVAKYALETISTEKLIMGLPFYGRSWGNVNANKAYLHSGIETTMQEQNIEKPDRENGIPTFRYETPLSVTVYYEDAYSLSARLEMYKKLGVNSVGFWRLGQETPAFWPLIGLQ